MKRRNRIYVDTSVFGGCFDDVFAEVSQRFFAEAVEGKHILLISEITQGELRNAPERVRAFVAGIPGNVLEETPFTEEMAELRDAYLAAKIVGKRWADDAAHVAVATVAHADLIVSWNFKHLVKWEKIRAFNGINVSFGYPAMTILSPREIIANDEGL